MLRKKQKKQQKPKQYRLESDIQSEIQAFLDRVIGARVWVNTPAHIDGKSYSAQGIPDITGVLPGGVHIAVEVKKLKSGRVSSQQKNHLVVTRALAGEAWVVYKENFEQFKSYMGFKYGWQRGYNKAEALLDSMGLATSKSGDIPAHRVNEYLTRIK